MVSRLLAYSTWLLRPLGPFIFHSHELTAPRSKRVDAHIKVTPNDVGAGILECELIGVSWPTRIVVNRLIVSLSPSTAFAIEEEAQHLAKLILDTRQEIHGEPGSPEMMRYPRFAIASSTIQTRESWEEACRNFSANGALATSSECKGEYLASKGVRQCLDESGVVDDRAQSLVISRGDRCGVIPKWAFERWCHTLRRKTS